MKPSLGVLIGLPIAAVVLLAGLALVVIGTWVWLRPDSAVADWAAAWWDFGLWGGLAAILITSLITGIAMWPWSAQYHEWRPESGTVTSVASRLLASDTQGGGSTQRFVVRFQSGDQYSCDDARCALVKAGDQLTLSCKRSWQWSGTPGWDCNYVSSTEDGNG